MLYIVENNGTYGLTKGQFSATNDRESVGRKGQENAFECIDLAAMAIQLGASFVGRGFSGDNLSGWQGEVKGSKANQGKIGGGPVNLLLKMHGLGQVDTQVAKKITNKNQKLTVITELKKNLKNVLGNEYSDRELTNMQATMTEKEFNSWLYSKSQGAQLAKIINSISNKTKQNQLCEDLYLYANSRSSISAPYYKLE